MKFEVYKDKKGEWRWNAQSGGGIIFASGEGFEKPQKAVQTIRKNIVREDVKLEAALVKALEKAGLDEKGGLRKTATHGPAKPVKSPKKLDPMKVPKPVKELSPKAAWPFPTGNKPSDAEA